MLTRNKNSMESKHSIFLSHSGAQKSFVEQLCLDIETTDRYPFFDKRWDSLPIGCHFPDLIFEAIKRCQVAVVILTEEFFLLSKWPMLELVSLVKRKTYDPNLTIMPVFLGMTHAQCREKENHDRWLKQWQCWAEKDERIIIEEWLAALKVFGYTNGISSSKSDEVKCRQEIVEAICREVTPESRWDDCDVQGRSRLCQVIRERIGDMRLSKYYGVQIVGIYGVGGIGKTTICKTLCNDYFEEFHGKVCHIEFGHGDELQMFQTMLKKFTNTKQELVENLNKDQCKDKMKRAIKNQRVLLAIDNVSESSHVIYQTKDILGIGFEQPSIIIVTARPLGELQNVNIHESECIEMPELTEKEAMSLFLYHASPGLYLKDVESKIMLLIEQCIQRCRFGKGNDTKYHYHPLSLKVLGGQLGNDSEEWHEKLKGIDPFNQYRERMHPIFSILKRSFDVLNDEDQHLFMDASIFYPSPALLVNMEVNIYKWISMVHGRSVDAILTMLKGLKRKSLLETLGEGSIKKWDRSKAIGMHDLWHEFAIKTAKGGEFDQRPWIYEKVYHLDDPRREESCLLRGGWENLQRMCMIGHQKYWYSLERYIVKEINLDSCLNLKVLKLVNVYPESGILDVRSLSRLKSLEFNCSSLRSSNLFRIPGLGCLRNLVFLHLSRIWTDTTSLYEDIGGLTNMQILHVVLAWHPFSNEPSTVEKLPDLSTLNLLQDVVLNYFSKANSIISGLSSKITNLKRLSLRWCSSLRSCEGVGDLVTLEELDLGYCVGLEALPNLRRLKNLLKLVVEDTKLIEVPGLDDLVSLQRFDATGCRKLANLPDMRKLVRLRKLNVTDCRLIKTMPGLSDLIALEKLEADYKGLKGCHDLHKLTKLELVGISKWSAKGIPCLSDLVNLKNLSINCTPKRVEELPRQALNLPRLESLEIRCCDFKEVQCLSNLTALECLCISECDKLEKLPDMHTLTRLETLEFRNCKQLDLGEWKIGSGLMRLFGGVGHNIAGRNCWQLPLLQNLSLMTIARIELPNLNNFPQLRNLTLWDCKEFTSLTSSAPLTALEHLSLASCMNLRVLPDFNHLVSLSYFKLKDCRQVKLTAQQIEKLKEMRPMLYLEIEINDLPYTELKGHEEGDMESVDDDQESDQESDDSNKEGDNLSNDERDAKRSKKKHGR